MSLKDIEKLKEKVDKDPLSKLFVPLSEEYKKEGMIDEAIKVLLTGIENQPSYMSARVALGKIYLEKGMLKEAMGEFEQVIRAIPDNLYAHKKLAEIYRADGNIEMAAKSYKTVLKLNAMDEEAIASLRELQEAQAEETAIEPFEAPAEVQAPARPEKEEAELETPYQDIFAEPHEEIAAEPVKEEELAAFGSSLFGYSEETAVASPQDLLGEKTVAEEFSAEAVEETQVEEKDLWESADTSESEDVYELEEVPEEDYEEMFAEEAAVEEEAIKEAAVEEELVEETAAVFPEVEETPPIPPIKGPSIPEFAVEEVPEMEVSFAESEETEDEKPSVAPSAPAVSLADADRYIAEERYADAYRVYKSLLAANPEDKRVLQRMDELRQLLKMLGRGKETIIAQLTSLLEGIKRKRDEFYRNT